MRILGPKLDAKVFVCFFLIFLGQGEAVDAIDRGIAPKIVQPEEGATYDAMMKKGNAKVSSFWNILVLPVSVVYTIGGIQVAVNACSVREHLECRICLH